jgi:hypothetical protein
VQLSPLQQCRSLQTQQGLIQQLCYQLQQPQQQQQKAIAEQKWLTSGQQQQRLLHQQGLREQDA